MSAVLLLAAVYSAAEEENGLSVMTKVDAKKRVVQYICTILKVDRRASRMQIEIPFARRIVKTWVEYEIISPEDKETIRFREEQKENPDGNKKPAD